MGKKPEDCVILLASWTAYWDFKGWKEKVNLTTQSEMGGNFSVYKVSRNKNNEEILTKIDSSNAKSRKTWVYNDSGFQQVVDEKAVREAELAVQKADLEYKRADLEYQQLRSQYSGSASAVSNDIDNDGKLTLSDITTLAMLYANGKTTPQKHDFNNDGKVDIKDITVLVILYANSR